MSFLGQKLGNNQKIAQFRYQLFHGIGIDARQCFRNVWMRGDDFSIDKQLSVWPGKNGDIPAHAQEDANIAAERLNCDLCSCGSF